MQTLWQDLRYAMRILLKKPGFTFVAILTLALGIGANTAIFSVINAVLLRPLPFPDDRQLLVLQQTRIGEKDKDRGVSYLNFLDWQAQNQSFESLAIVGTDEVTLTSEGEPLRVHSAIVSADFFNTLKIQPMLGNTFTAEDDQPGANSGFHSLMLTHSCWKNRFGGDTKIVGRTIKLDGKSFTVIGVTPPDIFPLQQEPVDFWTTVAVNGAVNQKESANASRGFPTYMGVIARLKPGVTLAQAREEMEIINGAIQEKYPASNAKTGVRLTGLRELVIGDVSSLLWLLLGIVSAVLLIACVNVANILLARAAARQREIAIRTALGASRWHIIRQLLTESLLLSLGGGLFGLLFSMWCVDGLVALLPADVPQVAGLTPDWRVLLFTFGITLLTGVICGLIPALTSTRIDVSEAVKEGGRASSGGVASRRLRNALVVVEVALALPLLIGAGLLVKSLVQLQNVNPGFETGNILTMQMSLSSQRYLGEDFSPERINAFLQQMTERIKPLPGVREVSFAQCVPLTSVDNNTNFNIVERPYPKGQQPTAQLRFIGLNYFKTLNIPQVEGRDFTERDNPKAPPVVIINEAFARQYFDGENPIGKKLKLGWGGNDAKEVVGIVSNVRHRSLSDEARAEMYVPQTQFPNAGITLLIRSTIKPETLIASVKKEIYTLDAELPLTEIKTLENFRADTLALPRFNTFLLTLFAGLALALTIIGLYGVISYSVSQRTREIGIRMAMGAQRSDVLKLVIKQGMLLTCIGVAFGLSAAFALTRLITSLLYQVTATDVWTFVVMALLFIVVALLACVAPARRATKVDPMIALRYE
jgi:putative ABC transport system permease protein